MQIPLSNLRSTVLLENLAVKCRKHSVIISSTPNLKKGGSGILVKYQAICGILTATHVMADYIEAHVIYSPLQPTEGSTFFLNIKVELQQIIYLETAQGINALKEKSWPSDCLDLCLLRMNQSAFDDVLHKSGKEAVDLSVYKQKYLSQPDAYIANDPTNSYWSWAIDGSPREQCYHDEKHVLHSTFDGLYVCGGSEQGTYKTDPLTKVHSPFDQDADRLQHDLGPTQDIIPDKFGGISGAGVWQVSFRGEQNIPKEIDEMLFSGICVAGICGKCLYSRGPTALYEIFTKYLDTFLNQ